MGKIFDVNKRSNCLLKDKIKVVLFIFVFCFISLSGYGICSTKNTLAESKNRAESHEMRMLMVASVSPVLLEAYLESETPVKVVDTASFPGEVIAYTPSKEEVRNALESAKLMQKADSLATSNPSEALKLYQNALAKNPHDPLLMMSIGVSQYLIGQKATARETLKKAYDMAPDGYHDKPRIKQNLNAIR